MSAIAGMSLTPGPGTSVSVPGVLPRQQPPITSASPPPFILQVSKEPLKNIKNIFPQKILCLKNNFKNHKHLLAVNMSVGNRFPDELYIMSSVKQRSIFPQLK